MDSKVIGQFIQKKRKSLGMTQKELAEQIGVSDKTLSKWENGVNMPDISVIPELCKLLNVTVNELLVGEEFSGESFETKADANVMILLKENKENKKLTTIQVLLGIVLLILGIVFLKGNHANIYDYYDWSQLIMFLLLFGAAVLLCRPRSKSEIYYNAKEIMIPCGGIVALFDFLPGLLNSCDQMSVWLSVEVSLMPLLYALIGYVIWIIIGKNIK